MNALSNPPLPEHYQEAIASMFNRNTMDNLGPLFNFLSDSIEVDKVLRSVLILVCGMLLFNLPTLLYKVRLFIRGILYFFFCWDKSFKKPPDPGSIFGPLLNQGKPIEKKTIYFVRHGESTWNETFNKGGHRSAAVFLIGFVPGLIKALLYELYLLLSGKLDRCVRRLFHDLHWPSKDGNPES